MFEDIVYDEKYYEEYFNSDEYRIRMGIAHVLDEYSRYFVSFCVYFNILHSFILLQKPLRTSSVFIIMMQICFFELVYFSSKFYLRNTFYSLPSSFEICPNNPCLIIYLHSEVSGLINDVSRRMFVCLMVQMALIRTIAITFPMSNWSQKFVKPRITILCSIALFVFWLAFHKLPLLVLYTYLWKVRPDTEAYDYYVDYAVVKNVRISATNFKSFVENSEGAIRTIIIILYTVLVIIMFVNLRIIIKKRKMMKSTDAQKSDNTTSLVILMTITFLISELWPAAVAFHKLLINRIAVFGFIYSSAYADDVTKNLRVLNSVSHVIICYFMSSQYRDVVHKLICVCSRNLKRKVILVKPSGSIESEEAKRRTTKNSSVY